MEQRGRNPLGSTLGMSVCVCSPTLPPTPSVPGAALPGCKDQSEVGREDSDQVGQRRTQGDAAETSCWFEVGRPKTVSERRRFGREHSRTMGFRILGELGSGGKMKHRRPHRQIHCFVATPQLQAWDRQPEPARPLASSEPIQGPERGRRGTSQRHIRPGTGWLC